MEPCVIDAQGVNSHDLDWKNRIEAEEFFSLRGGRKVDLLDAGGGDGFAVGAGHGALLRYPLITARVSAAIYWQAAMLYLKKCPFYPHPKSLQAETAR